MATLRWRTPEAWAAAVLAEPLALLDDHAHLERKAAANALELFARWPREGESDPWAATLAAVARDEVEHLSLVTRLLAARGGTLTRMHRNTYAERLRRLVRMGRGPEELVDRLLVAGLIEARSCERFILLAEHAEDRELRALYAGLRASEDGHWRAFLDLARSVVGPELAEARWEELLAAEAGIARALPPGPRIHSGPP